MGKEEYVLEELVREFSFMQEAVQRGIERMRRGKSMPEYIYKTVRVLIMAYTRTMRTNFPGKMAEQLDGLKEDWKTFAKMYSEQKKTGIRQYSASQAGDRQASQVLNPVLREQNHISD